MNVKFATTHAGSLNNVRSYILQIYFFRRKYTIQKEKKENCRLAGPSSNLTYVKTI